MIVGTLVTILALALFAGIQCAPADRELIENWRKIRLGMNRDEVERILGLPDYDIKRGSAFPTWAEKSVPDSYYLNHGLLVFTIRRLGPQLLLVYVDEDDCVVFVSNAPT
jgi:hypothetical protein